MFPASTPEGDKEDLLKIQRPTRKGQTPRGQTPQGDRTIKDIHQEKPRPLTRKQSQRRPPQPIIQSKKTDLLPKHQTRKK